MTERGFTRSGARCLVVLAAALASACGGGGGGKKVGNALSVCVLQGTVVSEGCYLGNDGRPHIALGSISMGEVRTRVVTIQAGGAASVDLTSVAFDGPTVIPKTYNLQLYTLVDGVETPVNLPVTLVKSGTGTTEVRARVEFRANQDPGAIGGVTLRIASPQVQVTIPITGEVTDCPGGRGNCDLDAGNGCETDLTVTLDHCGSCFNSCQYKPNVDDAAQGSFCDVGICKITLCTASWFDQNKSAGDGCECQQDTLGADTCETNFSSGNVAVGQSTSVVGSIVPIEDADYIGITWQGVEDPTFHPRIELVDESGVLAFDLTVGCGEAVTCNLDEGTPSAAAIRSWETSCSPGQGASCNYFLARASGVTSPVGEVVVARVYSTASTATETCLPYTLNISNAVDPLPPPPTP